MTSESSSWAAAKAKVPEQRFGFLNFGSALRSTVESLASLTNSCV